LPELLELLWGDHALDSLRFWQLAAIRVARLYSRRGDAAARLEFEERMRDEHWRSQTDARQPRVTEVIVRCGLRIHWGIALKQNTNQVEEILNSVGAP